MPALSWNEIRQNAIQFSREWKGSRDERAEAQTFWNEFFQVFGIRRRTVAAFEEPVKSIKNTHHRIDLFWKGRLLVEHKSAGESLDRAQSQAFQYIQELATSGRQDEIPRYVLLCNFVSMALFDLEPDAQLELPLWQGQQYDRREFLLRDLHANIKLFAFLIGQKTHTFGEQDEANLKAAAIMADLHDAVADASYAPEALERLLVRLLFCLFADDTGIFESGQFELYIENRTRADASDLGAQLNALFDVLNTPVDRRSKYLDEDLSAFPYINGELFAQPLPTAGFNRDMRNRILAACHFDWSRISPAIFGSLFQGIMDDKTRRQIGAHYTSERDILKVIRPLFLDELRSEFESAKNDRSNRRVARLHALQGKLTQLRFLDPACGCGNFLVIAYRELRRLELDILKVLNDDFDTQMESFTADESASLAQVDVHQFYGIEIGEWPARIAETALWLTDHQMNVELSLASGNLFQRIPLRAAPHIKCANALRFDWNELLPAKECSYVLGNPPFVGKHLMTAEQKADVKTIWGTNEGAASLDYVTCWYVKAADYIKKYAIQCAFVSTNSISQGEQVGYLWNYLYQQGIHINFAHRTFKWLSEAKGAAHVYVVIIGFGRVEQKVKLLFEYENITGEPHLNEVASIGPYLTSGSELVILPRSKPLCNVPPTLYGNKPADDGHLIIEPEEYSAIKAGQPELLKFIKPLICAHEYLHGLKRYCLWLQQSEVIEASRHAYIRNRLQAVREFRLKSKKLPTQDAGLRPAEFAEIRQPFCDYIVLPRHTSENRMYVPFGYFDKDTIIHDSCTALPNASSYHFGVLSSAMHMAWVRQVCGRLKSDYRYSAKLVYNNFPWPSEVSKEQQERVSQCAQRVLEARQIDLDKGATLADLYDPLTMPHPLLKAHQELDRAVDRCYRSKAFTSERERVEYLFGLYAEITSPLAPAAPPKKARTGRGIKSTRAAKGRDSAHGT